MSKFNAKKEISNITDQIRQYFYVNGPDSKAVIGISGGKDSTIAAALLCKALGRDKVFGVIMPNHEMRDQPIAEEVCEHLGIEYRIINIGETCEELYKVLRLNDVNCEDAKIYSNVPARVRMITLYAVAAAIGGRVINTSNLTEALLGYSTKYGDGAGDFGILRDYYVSEVILLGEELGLPDKFVHKAPDDGMSGKTDEEALGFTYKVADEYFKDGVIPDFDIYKKIKDREKNNRHKRFAMDYCRKKLDDDPIFF